MKTISLPATRENVVPAVDDTTCKPAPVLGCSSLRTKRMFIPAQEAGAYEVDNEINDRSFYWCNQTATEIGCDGGRVHPRVCGPGCGRACFRQMPS